MAKKTKKSTVAVPMSLTKPVISRIVAEKCDITYRLGAKVTDAVFEAVEAAILAGEKVSLDSFGTFRTIVRPMRTGRNPQTGEAVEVPEKILCKFKSSSCLKKALNGGVVEAVETEAAAE